MRRIALFVIGAASVFAVYLWIGRVSRREFPLNADLLRSLAVLKRVVAAENRCYELTHRYADLNDLGPGGCGGLTDAGAHDGFKVLVSAQGLTYSVLVHPVSKERLHSLYTDQDGVIHFGTRDFPAGPNSALLR
jgi:hypothetical protein